MTDVKVTMKVNRNAAKELAKQLEKNLRKKGVKAKMSTAEINKLQREINKLGR